MTPINNKTLLHFLFEQMEKLSKKEIEVDEAKAQALLAKQTNNIFKYEVDRVRMDMKIREFNLRYGTNVEMRNVESKNFD